MSHPLETRCICGHAKCTHIFDWNDSVCANSQCECSKYIEWRVTFRDPDGKLRTTSDIAKFVRDNAVEFGDDAVMIHWPCYPVHGVKKGEGCKAANALHQLHEGRRESWNGWTLAIKSATYKK